jgi:hypothetical protein
MEALAKQVYNTSIVTQSQYDELFQQVLALSSRPSEFHKRFGQSPETFYFQLTGRLDPERLIQLWTKGAQIIQQFQATWSPAQGHELVTVLVRWCAGQPHYYGTIHQLGSLDRSCAQFVRQHKWINPIRPLTLEGLKRLDHSTINRYVIFSKSWKLCKSCSALWDMPIT